MMGACSIGGRGALGRLPVRGLWLLIAVGLGACNAGTTTVDAGAGSKDAGGDGDGDGDGTDQRPRSDADQQGDPVPPCDRFDRFGCPAGQKCAIVIRRAPDEQGFGVYNGCVAAPKDRGLGAPCEQWSDEYEASGLTDEVYLDPCEQGLLCAPDPAVARLFTCQPSCQSGRYQGFAPNLCEDPGAYCSSVPPITDDPKPNRYLERCFAAADCDPADAGSCGQGRGCFPRLDDTGAAVLTECYAVQPEPVADFEACQFIDDCQAGSQCWGPVRVPPASWQAEERLCRPSCTPGAPPDAGAGDTDDEDAGMGGHNGGCPAGTVCEPLSESGLSLMQVGPVLGQCE